MKRPSDFGALLGLNVLAAGAAAYVWFTPPERLPFASGKRLEAGHLRIAKDYPLVSCPDMYDEACVRSWRHTPGLTLSLDHSPTFTSGNCLKIENPGGAAGEVFCPVLPMGGRVEYDLRIGREGKPEVEVGSRLGPQGAEPRWRSWKVVDWKPSFFAGWSDIHETVDLPPQGSPGTVVLKVRGKGTVRIACFWARRRS